MLVGAEGVVKDGGIINQLGSDQMPTAAKAHQWHVTAVSYKVSLLASIHVVHHAGSVLHLLTYLCMDNCIRHE